LEQPVIANIGLVATDLDGTLIGSANELPLYPDFSDRINRMREAQGTLWVACTGRRFSSFWEFFLPMRRMGILPDYVIIKHAFLYRRTQFGFVPHIWWNITTLIQLLKEGKEAREAIDHWHEALTGGAVGVSTVRRQSHRLCLRFDSEEAASVAADLLRERTARFKHLRVFLAAREVDVRLVPATKGMAVAELGRHLGVGRDGILTVGNGHNDISMLDGNVAAYTGCPSNSDEDVIYAVHKAGGHVAEHRALTGVMEILDAYVNGTVRSEIPESLKTRQVATATKSRRSRGMAKRRKPRTHPLLFAAIGYAALLVFASFDVLPYSSLIRKPLDLLIDLFAKVFS